VSPSLATGHKERRFNSKASATLLRNSGVVDGELTAKLISKLGNLLSEDVADIRVGPDFDR
jgi:hypothetical protein